MTGSPGPLRLNPVPVIVACEIVKLAFPESLSVKVWVFDTPRATEPKLTLAGTAAICGCIPTPLSAIVRLEALEVLEVPALLLTITLPLTVPMEGGVKVTVSETCLPAAKIKGTVIPLAVTPVPVVANFEIVTALLALLVTVIV